VTLPDYQSLMLPLLSEIADGQSHRTRDLIPVLAKRFDVAPAELAKLLPSGRQAVLDNRVHWAKTYLGKAGLLDAPQRGFIRITDEGTRLLATKPGLVNNTLLMKYPTFVEFRRGDGSSRPSAAPIALLSEGTPEETLEATWQTLRTALGHELLARIHELSPAFFERLVVDLLLKMGYGGGTGSGTSIGASGDGGIDGVINEDKLGLDVIYLQAKRWDGAVGRPVVQAFAGSLDGVKARKGVLITTSTFSQEARAYAANIEKRIVLIDGMTLVQLMMDHRVGVASARTYDVQRMDLDYFEDV
jgi:restriction system protein